MSRLLVYILVLSFHVTSAWPAMSSVFGGKQGEVKQEEPKEEETKKEEVKQEESKQEEVKQEAKQEEPAKQEETISEAPKARNGGASSVFGGSSSSRARTNTSTSTDSDGEEKSSYNSGGARSSSVFGTSGRSSSYSSSSSSGSSRSASVFGGRRGSASRTFRSAPKDAVKERETVSDQPSGAEPGKPAPENPRTAPKFLWPVDGGYVSSFFGWRNSKRFHDGIDIMAPSGTKVFASKSGQVIYSDSRIRGYGNMIVIRHNEGYHTVYSHNKTNKVRKGDIVSQGDVIALVGNTGHSSGPHLHFEIRKGKYSKDPLKFLGNVPGSKGAYRNQDGAALWK